MDPHEIDTCFKQYLKVKTHHLESVAWELVIAKECELDIKK
jgi:hypothetical protein